MEAGLVQRMMILIIFILCLHLQGEATETKGIIPLAQMRLLEGWRQKTKEAASEADAYIAKVEQYCQLKERIDSWLDPLNAIEMKTMLELRKQIGGDVGLKANDIRHILMGMTDQLINLFSNYVQELYKVLHSGNLDEMVKMQEQMPASIVDELLNYHFDHWRDVLQIAQNDNEKNESGVTALTIANANRQEIYQESYLHSLIAHLLLMGYRAILHLIT